MRKPIIIALSLLLCLLLCSCGKAETTLPEPTITPEQREQLKAELKEEIMSEMAENEPNTASGEAPEEHDLEPPKAPQNGEIRSELKEFLDSYEAFMDEYVDFMKRYQNADMNSMMSMIGEYSQILSKYADFEEKVDALDESTMSTAELSYYLEVTNRVSQKLLSVVG